MSGQVCGRVERRYARTMVTERDLPIALDGVLVLSCEKETRV